MSEPRAYTYEPSTQPRPKPPAASVPKSYVFGLPLPDPSQRAIAAAIVELAKQVGRIADALADKPSAEEPGL